MLAQLLNDAEVIPQVIGGKVTLHLLDDEGEFGVAFENTELFEKFGLTAADLKLDEHPEGADRGGYVPFAGSVHYREDLGEWVS